MPIASINRPAISKDTSITELRRWQQHTSDNVDRVNQGSGGVVSSYVAPSVATPLQTTVVTGVASLVLTPGSWLVSAIGGFTGTPTGTKAAAGISLSSSAFTTNEGDGYATTPIMATAGSDVTVTVASYPLTLTTTTTVYLVAACTFSANAVSAFGRISAVRVAAG